MRHAARRLPFSILERPMLAAVTGLTQLDETTCAGFRARLAAAGYDGGYLATLENIAGNMLQAARDPRLRSHLARPAGPAAPACNT